MAIDWDKDVLAPVMAVFGEDARTGLPVYMPATGAAAFTLVDAVFDREYLSLTLLDDGAANTTRRPVLGVRDALIPGGPQQNDKVRIPSVGLTYIVREVQPDSHGHSLLMLNQVAA